MTARAQRVLVIDDDEVVRETIHSVIAREPIEVAMAGSGREGLEILASMPVDLVLLDVMMPVMDGFEVCRRIKADPRLAPTPVILVTALDSVQDVLAGFEAGAEEFVAKPFNRHELRARVRTMLRLKRQHDELAAAHERLLCAHRHREALASFIIHDLKNPLAIVLANASMVSATKLTADAREAVQDITVAGKLMANMVMDLLDVARSEDAALVANVGDLPLTTLIEETVASMDLLAAGRRIAVVIESPRGLVVRADGELLRRVIANLLDNGLKYAPSNTRLTIEVSAGADRFEIRQRDEGAGIPAEERERIFDRYARAEAHQQKLSRTSRGLGLAFCRLAVEAHGGRIWVEGGAPRGTVFCVSIPQPPIAAPAGSASLGA